MTGSYPWNLENVPVRLKTTGKRVEGWQRYQHAAGPLLVSGQHRYGQGGGAGDVPAEAITLVPYGATTLRIAQFPVVE